MVDKELVDALTEVRKAYRLVHKYQRRILDMTKFIVEKMGYFPYWWDNEYFDVRSNRVPSERYAFDTMPLYVGTYMLFLRQENPNKIEPGEGLLDIQFEVDSGFKDSKQEPDTSSFSKSSECESYLYLGAICSTENKDANWLYNVYNETEYPEIGENQEGAIRQEGSYILFRNRYNLTAIKDEEDLLVIIEDFQLLIRTELRKKGIEIVENHKLSELKV